MKYYYDLHIHSCLSPCGDADMTPNNIVNMAGIKGLRIIALTDHNSCLNCPAAVEAGREAGVLVVPGMELCTSEEIHVICLFPELQSALDFGAYVGKHIPPIKNRPEIFGNQTIMDERDRIVGEQELLLITASDISITSVTDLAGEYGGVCFPAHIDRDSYSILASLGEFPPDLGFRAAEISGRGNTKRLRETYPTLKDMPVFHNSDAHYLGDISEPSAYVELPELSAGSLLEVVRSGNALLGVD